MTSSLASSNVIDAEQFLDGAPREIAKFQLELHPDKTRLVEFGPLCDRKPEKTRSRQTGNVQLPWLYAHLR